MPANKPEREHHDRCLKACVYQEVRDATAGTAEENETEIDDS